ncbi:cation diffusion facilitator family transporter [Croceibacterium aestuarii]|uniref:cation diffusion facilitator family transporter n=1 Tax=Croceibacterium aestuarii TaxID=3064139 RepID=UPI00272EA756|nr:cation diffusion facilitator family transporter [Croceibacterium sp. D39]
MASGRKLAIYAALGGNVAVAITKFVAAFIAGSSSMLTEGIHSLVDSGNEVLLLYGEHRAERPPDELHPLGYGREVYFWSFVVALLIFTAGAGVSVYEGILHILHPEMLEKPLINFAVLGASIIFEAASMYFGLKEFRKSQRKNEGAWRTFRTSKDPTIFVVLLENLAALIGLVIAAAFIGLTVLTGNPVYDGIGSVLIGLLLGAVAIILAIECKHLLIGERASPQLQKALKQFAEREKGVCLVNEVITIHLSPKDVVAMLSLDLEDELPVGEVEGISQRIEQTIKAQYPEVRRIFIRPQSRHEAGAELAALRNSAAPA